MRSRFTLIGLLMVALAFGCTTVPVVKGPETPPQRPVSQYVKPDVTYTIDAYDPWEPMNRRIYNFNARFDEYVYLPVVRAYEFVLPDIVETGISNFFKNLTEVTNLTNALLQLKWRKSANTLGRIAVNTTIGVGGFIDVATSADWIRRENEDLGQTLGFYGLGPGPYLVLPILGPSNVRDTAGLAVDTAVYSLMLGELIDLADLNSPEDDILNYSLAAIYAIDKRHREPFRYYRSGSPFEYDLVRRLVLLKRELDIQN